jgi:hypothetical protein
MSTMRSIARTMEKASGDFKGAKRIKGYRNQIAASRANRGRKSGLSEGVGIFAKLFQQIFGASLRSAKAK